MVSHDLMIDTRIRCLIIELMAKDDDNACYTHTAHHTYDIDTGLKQLYTQINDETFITFRKVLNIERAKIR